MEIVRTAPPSVEHGSILEGTEGTIKPKVWKKIEKLDLWSLVLSKGLDCLPATFKRPLIEKAKGCLARFDCLGLEQLQDFSIEISLLNANCPLRSGRLRIAETEKCAFPGVALLKEIEITEPPRLTLYNKPCSPC